MCTSAAAVKLGRKLYNLGIAFHLSPSMRITASLPIMQFAFISCALVTYGCPLHSWCFGFCDWCGFSILAKAGHSRTDVIRLYEKSALCCQCQIHSDFYFFQSMPGETIFKLLQRFSYFRRSLTLIPVSIII